MLSVKFFQQLSADFAALENIQRDYPKAAQASKAAVRVEKAIVALRELAIGGTAGGDPSGTTFPARPRRAGNGPHRRSTSGARRRTLDLTIDIASTVDEGLEEHHVAKVLLEELRATEPGSDQWVAKVKVLMEIITVEIQ